MMPSRGKQSRSCSSVAMWTCVLLVLCGAYVAEAAAPLDSEDRPLENRDVAAMAAAGIGESVVIAAVEHAPREELDATEEALEELRESGVSDAVLAAVRSRVENRAVAETQEQSGGASETARAQRPRRPDEIKLYFNEKPSLPFTELGRVSAGKFSTFGRSQKRDAIDKELREKAAELGGDAVINITEDFASVSGVVIRFD